MVKERIGFIGVGLMGHGMAANIVGKGWPLTVMGHRNREPVEDLKARGASEAATPRELAEQSDIVILCVTGSPEVQGILQGPDGLAAAGKPLLVVDCSTSDPSVTMRLAAELAPAGITLIDAPLSRTPADAQAGTLDVMVGGDPDAVARARPVIDAFAGRVMHTGPTGTGHTMKLLNNFLSLGYAAIYAEALALGAKAGLTPQVFDSVIRGGRMDCGFYQTFFKWVLDRDPNAHKFAIRNGLKDMTYLASLANSVGSSNPVGAAVRNSFALAVGTGHGDDYVPMLTDAVAELNGIK
ncbi:NAD(P)-dependent oxidoreductase [Microvirga lenta]|uniref:NAD(P)-dependent oxidoreductase n=1 Tax=Microvirga lenta TaxID=2881337 RepID=UPI001CFFA118|nr:NAD(P)-dependent oxidoreductase [Microvirga lenta]MCB5176163.1 NAD(P)-dependent oxidoreductase [Microvirga lenta]